MGLKRLVLGGWGGAEMLLLLLLQVPRRSVLVSMRSAAAVFVVSSWSLSLCLSLFVSLAPNESLIYAD